MYVLPILSVLFSGSSMRPNCREPQSDAERSQGTALSTRAAATALDLGEPALRLRRLERQSDGFASGSAASSASSTLGGDIGRLSRRRPRAPWTALATAAITGTSGTSPTPR